MRRLVLILVLVGILAAAATAQSVGGGISVWLPESQYLAQEGSVGVESALGSSLGLGEFLSVPFGIAFTQVYGLMPEFEGTVGDSPWFYADTALAFLMVKARAPLGVLYVDLFGGVNGVWNMTLRPLEKNIEVDSAPAGHLYSFEDPITVTDGQFGWGWQAGGGIGVTIDQISVEINVTYRVVRSGLTLTGEYSDITVGSGTVAEDQPWSQALQARMAGFSIGIDGSFAF